MPFWKRTFFDIFNRVFSQGTIIKKIRNVFMSTPKVIISENKYFLGAIGFECAAPAIVNTCKEA